MIELLLVMAVAGVLVGIGLPVVKKALSAYNLSAAVAAVTGSIESTRYQAIATGCPYTIAFSPLNNNYQVSYEPLTGSPPACATTFSNLKGAVPWAGSGGISLSPATTLQFSPNGSVTATAGSLVFTLANDTATETITVSGVGNVTVSP